MTVRMFMKIFRTAMIVVAWLAIVPATPAIAKERVLLIALDYAGAENTDLRLSNPVRDARALEKSFRKAGQKDVTLIIEPGLVELDDALFKFTDSLAPDDVALVYYAGHAIQYGGENYLIAGDGKTLINIGGIISQVSDAGRATVFFIDACRNNPFSDEVKQELQIGQSRSTRSIEMAELEKADGLAQISDLRGLSTVIFFSTEPGNVAMDGAPGKGSPFADALQREIPKRQSLDTLLKRAAIRVNKETGGVQSPWRQGDIPFDIFIAGMKTMVIP